MNGPGDICAARIRKIARAGVHNCMELARKNGRKEPERDLAIIRKAAVGGYRQCAKLMGCAESTALRTVKIYSEYAEQILADRSEK